MGRASRLSRFVGTFIVSLVLTGGVLLLLLRGPAALGDTAPVGEPRTGTGTRAGFELEVVSRDGTRFGVTVGAEGRECEALGPSSFLGEVCRLTTLVDGPHIAATARGALSDDGNAAAEAIIWRGVLSQDVAFCEDSGLTDGHLASCVDAVEGGQRVVSDSNVTVSITAGS